MWEPLSQGLELLRHFFHEAHGEASPELVLRLEMRRAGAVECDFEEEFAGERGARSVQTAPGGKNHGLKLAAMPGAHLVVQRLLVCLSAPQEVGR